MSTSEWTHPDTGVPYRFEFKAAQDADGEPVRWIVDVYRDGERLGDAAIYPGQDLWPTAKPDGSPDLDSLTDKQARKLVQQIEGGPQGSPD